MTRRRAARARRRSCGCDVIVSMPSAREALACCAGRCRACLRAFGVEAAAVVGDGQHDGLRADVERDGRARRLRMMHDVAERLRRSGTRVLTASGSGRVPLCDPAYSRCRCRFRRQARAPVARARLGGRGSSIDGRSACEMRRTSRSVSPSRPTPDASACSASGRRAVPRSKRAASGFEHQLRGHHHLADPSHAARATAAPAPAPAIRRHAARAAAASVLRDADVQHQRAHGDRRRAGERDRGQPAHRALDVRGCACVDALQRGATSSR